jgi:hypothetical protein
MSNHDADRGHRARVFLSYARRDRAFALTLARVLEAREFVVWWDRSIKPGTSYQRTIESELQSADWVVVLWSQTSVESDWVIDEAARAQEGGKLIPVLVEPVSPPLGFGRLQAIDLSRWNGDGSHPGFLDLERHMSSASGPAAPVPGAPVSGPERGAAVKHGIESAEKAAPASEPRPKRWYCVYCGQQAPEYNDLQCVHCSAMRPYFPAGATMKSCDACSRYNLLMARFCEWCGAPFAVSGSEA